MSDAISRISPAADSPNDVKTNSPARVLTASLVGTTIEFFDFYVYATAAALVIGPVFFPQTSGTAQMLSAFLTFGIAFIWMLRAKSLSRIALKTNVDSKLTSSHDLGIKVGDEGVTVSRLAPIGKARINGVIVEAKSLDELIDEKTEVTVIRVDGYNVIVERKNK